MRKHDARKWLHAVLDLLPVILIPAFMIYSHRHSMTEQTTVDIQYKYQSNEVNSLDDLQVGNIYFINELTINIDNTSDFEFDLYFIKFERYNSNIAFSLSDFSSDGNDFNAFNIYGDGSSSLELYFYSDTTPYTLSLMHQVINNDYITIYNGVFFVNDIDAIYNWWDNSFPNILPQYTDYNVIESVDVHDETSNIMNVFMDNFNNTVDKYFNMGNVFNLNGVYQWFNTNIFGGTAPAVIYSVWNIALYELVMDLLFLLYGLFMWFIDMCQHLMEKPFRSIK